MLASPWVSGGGPQQNIPSDDVPGINTFGLDATGGRNPIPFWDQPSSLDPSNSNFPEWAVVRLAGQTLPGLCSVSGGRAKRFDIKKSPGKNFATITHQGFDPATIKVTERIWTRQQLYALWLIMPLLQPMFEAAHNAASLAVDVYHPALALQSISAVLISRISLLHPTPGTNGCWEQDIELIEWRKPDNKNATETPIAAASFVRGSPGNQLASFQPQAAPLASFDPKFMSPTGH